MGAWCGERIDFPYRHPSNNRTNTSPGKIWKSLLGRYAFETVKSPVVFYDRFESGGTKVDHTQYQNGMEFTHRILTKWEKRL